MKIQPPSKKRRWWILLTFLLLVAMGSALFFLWWQSPTTTLVPAPPEILPNSSIPALPASDLHAECRLPVSQIEALANRKLPNPLYTNSAIDLKYGARLALTIARNGTVHMTGRNDAIYSDVPLRAFGKVMVEIPLAITTIKQEIRLDAAAVLHLTTRVSLDSTWKLVPRTVCDFTWVKRPVVEIIPGLGVDLSGLAEKEIDKQLRDLTPQFDQMLRGEVDPGQLIEPVWFKLGMSFSVKKEPPIWLRANPEWVAVSPVTIAADTLAFQLELSSVVETFVGNQPPPRQIHRMPPLQTLPDTMINSRIYARATITYEDASALLNENLTGRTFQYADQFEIQVGTIRVYGSGDFLVFAIDFEAHVLYAGNQTRVNRVPVTKGRVYLKGKPVYDAARQVLRVDSLNYDLETRNVLARTADWMLSDQFLSYVQDRLEIEHIPLTEHIEYGRLHAQQAVDTLKLGKHVVLSGVVERLEPVQVLVGSTELFVDVLIVGDMWLTFDLSQI